MPPTAPKKKKVIQQQQQQQQQQRHQQSKTLDDIDPANVIIVPDQNRTLEQWKALPKESYSPTLQPYQQQVLDLT